MHEGKWVFPAITTPCVTDLVVGLILFATPLECMSEAERCP
jgi:hypothetical protein